MTAPKTASSRLPLVDAPDDPLVREQFVALASGGGILNLHRMMAHAPPLMRASGEMALAFRRDTGLSRSLAELAVLRTAQVLDCAYIWSRHLSLARACGVTERQIDELAHWPESAAFTPAQKAALGFAEKAARMTPIGTAISLGCGGTLRRGRSSNSRCWSGSMPRPRSSSRPCRCLTRRRDCAMASRAS
jgi:AhpD family alkylhydroperoxidase